MVLHYPRAFFCSVMQMHIVPKCFGIHAVMRVGDKEETLVYVIDLKARELGEVLIIRPSARAKGRTEIGLSR